MIDQTKIKFYEKSHTYKVNKKKLKSVTETISTIFPPFDAKGIARNIAKGFKYRTRQSELRGEQVDDVTKAKGTMRYWLNKWKDSAEHGTRVHKAVEEFINLGDATYVFDRYCETELDKQKFTSFMKWYNDSEPIFKGATLLPEFVIYNEKLGYAGTIDLVLLQEDGTMHIFDWKSNEKLLPNTTPKQLEEPFTHLDDSKICRYSLQLSFYKYLLQLSGAKIGNLQIVHLKPDKYVVYNCTYLEDEVKKLIEVDKNGKEE